jgi:hypothetical protein
MKNRVNMRNGSVTIANVTKETLQTRDATAARALESLLPATLCQSKEPSSARSPLPSVVDAALVGVRIFLNASVNNCSNTLAKIRPTKLSTQQATFVHFDIAGSSGTRESNTALTALVILSHVVTSPFTQQSLPEQ